MECKCGYKTDNKKSWSNHIRYGCSSKIILDTCLNCGASLPINIKPSDGRKFCNHKCYAIWRSKNLIGEKAPNYVHGKCNDNLLFRASKEFKAWRKSVFKRDNYTCQKCGSKSTGNLEAHHIKDFALYPELRLDINNGLSLCKDCHRKTDNYGFKKSNSKTNKI